MKIKIIHITEVINMKVYTIRITTINGLYADYIIEANCLLIAKEKAKKAFFRDYPDADKNIKLSLAEPKAEIIKEILDIIREAEQR